MWVFIVTRLLKPFLVESGLVGNQNPTFPEVTQVCGESGWIHGDQCVDRIPGCVNLTTGEVDLKPTNASECTARGTDLGGKVGKGGYVVAD